MSIDALQLLTKQIATQVQTLVGAPLPEGKHADTLESVHVAFGQGLAIVGGLMNAAAPINRVPPELLASIFALSSGTHSPGSQLPYWPFEEPHVDDLHKLPKVCRYWRELALAAPTLWSTVVIIPHSQGSDYCFGRSIYLPDDLSIDLTVHFNPRRPTKRSTKKMTKFMLKNAPRIRELHAWDSSSIVDLPLFLRSFDANALEHCTIWPKKGFEVPPSTWPESGRLSFFSNGGARLRSLCLTDMRVLPKNKFPALTLLKIGFDKTRDVNLQWDVEDLVKFLAGSPRLEEVYVHDMPFSGLDSPCTGRHPVSSTPVSLPRLQYLAFTYFLDMAPDGDDAAIPIDFLLSRVSIPPACHLYLAAPVVVGNRKRDSTNSAAAILDSVCRRVPGKDAVSHIFLRLSDISSPLQLVFRQGSGSLRLQIPPPGAATGAFRPLFRTFPRLFATAEELRIHYTHDRLIAALPSLFPTGTGTGTGTAFPGITALSIIRDTDLRWLIESKPTLRAGLAHLTPPSTSPTGVESAEHRGCPYPALDTLWTSLGSSNEIGELEATLAARAALRSPIRRLVVTVCYSPPADSDDVARLRALGAEDVIVMHAESSGAFREVDWLERLPERHSLPPSVHRDWPAVWGGQR